MLGTIKTDGGGSDVFVHVRDAEASGRAQLVVGERYEYAEFFDERRDKFRATDLRLLSQA